MTAPDRLRRSLSVLTVASLLPLGLATAPPAWADTAPSDPALPVTVTADPLPTAQIDGVAWTQLIVGSTVYVGGRFSSARPAGSPAGSNETGRSNLLAYDLASGTLLPFAPTINGQVKDLAVAPDQRTLYVAGQFTLVNGQNRYRVAAFDVSTGGLVAGFRPSVNSTISTVAAGSAAVYLGGSFSSVNGVARTRLAAVSPTTGSTLPFTATVPDGAVLASTLGPGQASIVIGGSFTSVNGSTSPGYGLARLDATTGATQPLPVNAYARNGGSKAAILSLETDGQNLYGAGYVFGSGGNIEGSFASDWATGSLVWVEDCHGDTYSAFPAGGVVYSASHKHYCGNNGGFPQTTPWSFNRGTATTTSATRLNTADYLGYVDHRGQPSPSMLTWFPTINAGTFTGKSQGPWTVSGNGSYVLYGGEFTQVNGRAQQGLVRFATSDIAPDAVGPSLSGSAFPLVAAPDGPGRVRLTWRTNDDRDNETLTYRIYRGSDAGPALYQSTVTTTFWRRQAMTYLDTGQPSGTQRYRVVAADPFGNTAASPWVTATVGTSGVASTYAQTVLDDAPTAYWRLGEPTGSTAADATGFYPLTTGSGVTRGTAGAIAGDPSSAVTLNGSSSATASSTVVGNAPETVSVEAWFRTTTTRGGKLLGFSSSTTGTSGIADRHLYLDNAGRVFFGMQSGGLATVNGPAAYNDGAWHHAVGTYGAGTLRLYVDGFLVAQRSDVLYVRAYWGYWRLGGDRLSGWPSRPTNDAFTGTLDEVSVYHKVLTASAVAAHYAAGRAVGPPPNLAPVASFTESITPLAVAVDASGSTDPDGTISSWAWTFGDGSSGTGRTTTHTYPSPGTFTVTLTVTDDRGATTTTSRPVTVPAPAEPGGGIAQDGFGRLTTGGWGAAEVGGPWTAQGTSSRFSADGQRALHTLVAGATLTSSLDDVAAIASDITLTVGVDRLPTGGNLQVHVQARRAAPTSYYGARLALAQDGAVQLHVTRGNGTPVNGGVVGGLTVAAGARLAVRVQVEGADPTTVRARVWPDGQPEPTTWRASFTDATAGLQTAGSFGLATYLAGAVTNGPATVAFDDLRATPLP